jgi:transposase
MYITRSKKDYIRRCYIGGKPNIKSIADILDLSWNTVRFYLEEFRMIEQHYPEKLNDFKFFIGKDKVSRIPPKYQNLVKVLPGLVANEEGPVLVGAKIYRKYAVLCPGEFSEQGFYPIFRRWFDQHKAALCEAKLKVKYTEEELSLLRSWRNSNDHQHWQMAVALMSVFTYHTLGQVAQRIECTYHTMLKWLRLYQKLGLEGLEKATGPKRPISAEKAAAIEVKKDNLVHLVRQSPKLYGIDRTSWCITDLAFVYTREFGQSMTQSTVCKYLKQRGVRYKRSREVIASTDPLFKEKYAEIQRILEQLGEKEKFFSIDEYGPRSVRPKGGRMLCVPGFQPVYQRVDKGKGWFICTCALELSSNQLTWFYSPSKDTSEMIRLIEVLTEKYKDQERLYISWDAASWHASRQLYEHLDMVNDPVYRAEHNLPEILLAPLPARAANLNVIESVFSGMSKSVIHHSDYESTAECTAAVDRYFQKRNQYYRDNPKRAGQKIWGKEKVRPVFNKANICKNL